MENDLRDYLISAQVDALATKGLGMGQADPFANIMADAAAAIRSAIASNSGNTVSATANSVPAELKWVLCVKTLEFMQGRITSFELTKSQLRQLDEANQVLKDIMAGTFKVTLPPDPIAGSLVQFGSPAVVVSSSTRLYTRDRLNGL